MEKLSGIYRDIATKRFYPSIFELRLSSEIVTDYCADLGVMEDVSVWGLVFNPLMIEGTYRTNHKLDKMLAYKSLTPKDISMYYTMEAYPIGESDIFPWLFVNRTKRKDYILWLSVQLEMDGF